MTPSSLLILGCAFSVAFGESTNSYAQSTKVPEAADVNDTNGDPAASIDLTLEDSEPLISGDPGSQTPTGEEASEGDLSSSRAEKASLGEWEKPWPYPGVLVRAIGGRVDPSVLYERFGRYEYAGNGLFRSAAVRSNPNVGDTSDETRVRGSGANVRSLGSPEGPGDHDTKSSESAEEPDVSFRSSESPKVNESEVSETETMGGPSIGPEDGDSDDENRGVSVDDSTPSS
ncbi:uncharacterized protein LOC135208926 [Macrobrachium nipponense]|uniref:uncharacterized protein LOC135208926 n=1 Tax=Macrobrachium nipponense TaxID=159736 RepID=UPI0030C82B6F